MKEIAERFGYAVGLDNAEMNKLLLLVEYHDIGIVALKNHSEKGLNYEKHPEVGYKIALNFPEIAPIAEYILYHHERWDGQGYPKKLRGNEIPLLSRLVSILDFYAKEKCKDGEPKQSDERIILELGKRAGSEFDPDLVKLFTKLLLL
jgi:HD-GYP domain-containing protein (c-di-GMP phosphodiesterase class II)